MLDLYLTVVGAVAVGLAFLSNRMRELPLSEPLLALVTGVVAGPQVLGILALPGPGDRAVLLEAARILLAVSLMAVALRYPPATLRARVRPVALLLCVVMPAMAGIAALLGGWLLGLPAAAAWLLGAVLAPTDPVLASSVVTGEPAERLVPARLRELLSIESGANDGLAFPLVVLGITLVVGDSAGGFLASALWGVLGALAVGAGIGALAGRGIRAAHEHHEMEDSVVLVFSIVLALFALGVAHVARTDGLLAVFVAGLAYNATVTGVEREPEHRIDEAVNRFAVLPTFVLFGVALPWADWARAGWRIPAFAIAVILLHRLPIVALLRRPLRLDWPGAAFHGWFGPIGAAALFYLAHAHERGATDPLLWSAGTAAIALSVVVFGVTSAPGRRWYARAQRRGAQEGERT